MPTPHFLRLRRSVIAAIRRYFGMIAFVGMAGFAAVFAVQNDAPSRSPARVPQSVAGTSAATTLVGYAAVVDGDTLRLNGKRIRIIGIDAPELHQTCRDGNGGEWACGRAARYRMAALVAAGRTTCAARGRGYYGRTLATCSVNGIDLGGTMVREGNAIDFGGYAAAESEARQAHNGLWAGDFERPQVWRRMHLLGSQ